MFYNAIVYSRKSDNNGAAIKALLQTSGIPYTEAVVGSDIIQEDVNSLFPAANGNESIVAVNGRYVGNYGALREWLNTRPTFLAE